MLQDFTLLYVEDDKDTQEYMKFYLSDEVKEFYQAFNGEEGIEIYKSKKPDIIVTDLNMPKLNGIDMIKQIKSIDKEQIIIITSAFGDKNNLMEALNYGANGFISKPIDIDKFNEKLLEVTASLKEKIEKDRDKKILYNLAHYDELTKIKNRLSFNQSLAQLRDNQSPFSLFFIDLDNFKLINDNYGHKAGDEFVIIIKDIVDIDNLNILAQKIIDATSIPLIYNENILKVSASIGISRYTQDTLDIDLLLKLADKAMYMAKKGAKSNFAIYGYNH